MLGLLSERYSGDWDSDAVMEASSCGGMQLLQRDTEMLWWSIEVMYLVKSGPIWCMVGVLSGGGAVVIVGQDAVML